MKIDLTTDDLGAKRLADALAMKAKVDKIIETVSALHAVRPAVVRLPGKLARKPHIVLARSHAAWMMNAEGMTSAQMGRALNVHGSVAFRAARRWEDYKAGRLETATEGQVWKIKALVEQGASVNDACADVGVGRSKYDSRATLMKAEGKL